MTYFYVIFQVIVCVTAVNEFLLHFFNYDFIIASSFH